VGRDVRVGQPTPDRRAQQVRLGLVDAAHHHSNAAQGGLHRIGVTDVNSAATYAVPELGREPCGLLGASARHDDPIRIVRREIRRHAAPYGTVAAGDQDIGAVQHRLNLLRRAGRQIPGANGAAGFG
jgi:hypothetical protein